MSRAWAEVVRGVLRRGKLTGVRRALLIAALSTVIGVGQSALHITASMGFEDADPAVSPVPITLAIDHPGTEALTLDISVVATRFGVESGTLTSRAVEVSPQSVRQVTVLVGGRELEGCHLHFAASREVDWVIRGVGTEEIKQVRRRSVVADMPARPRGWMQRTDTMLVIGGRARQIRSVLAARTSAPDGTPQAPMLGGRPVSISALDAKFAPDTWLAYSGLGVIFWTEPAVEEMPNPAQVRALREWVEIGGHLVILSARTPERLRQESLAPFLPATVKGAVQVDYPAIDGQSGAPGPWLDCEPKDGARAEKADHGPWPADRVVRINRRLGNGRVTLACVDPLAYDTGDQSRLAAALRAASGVEIDVGKVRPDRSWFGGTEGVGERVWARLENNNVFRPNLGILVFAGWMFVVLIGPIDFMILKKYRKLHWSPLTLVGYTLLFSLGCIITTYVAFAPSPEVNRLAIADFVTAADGTERVMATVYRGRYAPYGATEVALVPGADQFGRVISGSGDLGDEDSGRSWPEPGQTRFDAPGVQPAVVSQPMNSFRVTESRVFARAKGWVSATFEPASRDLLIRNQMPVALRQAVFAYQMNVNAGSLPIPDVAPGGVVRLSASDIAAARRERKADEPAFVNESTKGELVASWDLVDGLRSLSLPGWVTAGPRNASRNPPEWWRSLGAGRGIVMGMIDGLPFEDAPSDVRVGFSWSLVRVFVDLPPRKD